MANEDSIVPDPDEPAGLDTPRPSLWLRLGMVCLFLLLGMLLVFALERGWGNFGDREKLLINLKAIRHHPWAPGILVVIFALGGLIGLPLKLILVGATVVLGPWLAFPCGYVGTQLSALAGFGIGRRYGKPILTRVARKYLARLNALLHRRGISSVLLVRLVPIAPFVIVNLAAGASRLSFREFFLGTLVGIGPGIAGVVLLTHTLAVAIVRPDWKTILGFVGIFAFVVLALIYVHRTFAAQQSARSDL